MPLSPTVPRKPIHTRAIACQGYLREDGLWDIEAHIQDTKSYHFHNEWKGPMPPGSPVHNFRLRLTMDDDLTIKGVETVMDDTPYPICGEVVPNFQRLVGERIKSGWRRRVKELLGGAQGCVHLVELLGPMGTVAHQTIRPYRRWEHKQQLDEGEEDPTVKRPHQINTCYAWAADNVVVRRYLPEYYTGPNPPPPDQAPASMDDDWGPSEPEEGKPPTA